MSGWQSEDELVNGQLVSATNPQPVQLSVGNVAASPTNPVPAQLSVAGAAATAANPVPAQLSLAGAVVASGNPLPITDVTSNSFTPTGSSGAGTTHASASTVKTAIAANAGRKFLRFTNLDGAATINVSDVLAAPASATVGIPVLPGQTYTFIGKVSVQLISTWSTGTSVPYFIVEG
jgi:hypothetical protein